MAQDVVLNLYRNQSDILQSGYSPNPEWEEGSPPVTNSASGTYVDGNTITLNGLNFSSKTSTPTLFTNFSGGVVGQRAAEFHYWNMTGTADYLITDGVTAPLGSGKIIRAHPIQQSFTEIHYELDEDTDEIFLEAWCRTNRIDFTSSPDAPQIKSFRFVDGTGELTMQDRPLNIALLFDSAGDLQASGNPVVGNGAFFGTAPSSSAWVKYTMYARKGDLDTANGERFIHVGAENSFTFSGIPGGHFASPTGVVPSSAYQGEGVIMHTSSSAAYLFRRVALPYFQREQQESIVDIAQIYINTSKERVVIGDSATWAGLDQTKTHCVNVTNRQYDQIQFIAEDGQFPTGALYAYVINRDGLYNTNGILVRAA
jgi:hypothetical protein